MGDDTIQPISSEGIETAKQYGIPLSSKKTHSGERAESKDIEFQQSLTPEEPSLTPEARRTRELLRKHLWRWGAFSMDDFNDRKVLMKNP